jgi:hypothetical protein
MMRLENVVMAARATLARFLEEFRGEPMEEQDRIISGLKEASLTRKRGGRRSKIVAPEGGKLFYFTATVDPNKRYLEALEEAGPAPGADWHVRKMGDLYPPEAGSPRQRKFCAVNFGPGSLTTATQALAWAERQKRALTPVGPRDIFAIAKQVADWPEKLGTNPATLISTTPKEYAGRLHVPGVWAYGAERGAGAYWFLDEGGDSCGFVFACD